VGVDQEEQERRFHKKLGIAVVVAGILGFVVLFFGRDPNRFLAEHTSVYSDFPNVTGLRDGSPVQLAGVQVGRVERLDFVHVRYECDPLTEDIGRWGQGRTDSCDGNLFCAPVGLCADLEPYAGSHEHSPCDATEDCADDEVCVTGPFRQRESKVEWTGQLGLCARFNTTHWRTRVKMKLPTEQLSLIRTDSRANVAANTVLGDQLVNISPGQGDPLEADYRIQARSSLAEDIEKLRARIDRALENADDAMIAILDVIDVLKDEKTLSDLKGIFDNFEVISRDVAYGEGLIGALLSSQEYRNDIGTTISSLRNTASGLETAVDHSNLILDKVDRNIEPAFKDTRATLQEVDALLVDLESPTNKSLVAKVLRDDKGDIARDLELIFDHTADFTGSTVAITRAVEQGDGTLGKLINDDRVRKDLGRLLHNLARHGVIRSITLWYLDKKGLIHRGSSRESSRPARRPRPDR
jgi:ABC-type transporter Mla subunit MlaD